MIWISCRTTLFPKFRMFRIFWWLPRKAIKMFPSSLWLLDVFGEFPIFCPIRKSDTLWPLQLRVCREVSFTLETIHVYFARYFPSIFPCFHIIGKCSAGMLSTVKCIPLKTLNANHSKLKAPFCIVYKKDLLRLLSWNLSLIAKTAKLNSQNQYFLFTPSSSRASSITGNTLEDK